MLILIIEEFRGRANCRYDWIKHAVNAVIPLFAPLLYFSYFVLFYRQDIPQKSVGNSTSYLVSGKVLFSLFVSKT
jgi:hypothetical protein